MGLFSKRSREGELMIDHQASPGLTAEQVPSGPIVGKGQVFETPIVTCGHCRCVIVLNPDRTRERGYCQKCDHYICDNCAVTLHLTLQCTCAAKRIDALYEEIEHGSTGVLLTQRTQL